MNTRDPDPARGPIHQLIASVSALFATAISMGRTRVELLAVEIREQLHWTTGMVVWGAVALIAAAVGVLFAGLTLIFALWDTHRILAGVLVALGYFVLAAVAAAKFRSRLRSRPPFLNATLAELARDEDKLSGRQQ